MTGTKENMRRRNQIFRKLNLIQATQGTKNASAVQNFRIRTAAIKNIKK